MAETIEELRSLSREELIRRHDGKAQSTEIGTRHYLAELERRDAHEQAETMVRLTRALALLTVAIVALTVVSVVAVLVDVL